MLPAALWLSLDKVEESAAQKLKAAPLSNNIICSRIYKIPDDVNDQLVAKMCGNEFSLQLEEATTRNKDAYLIYYVHFIDNDDNIVEDLPFCKPILTNCRAHELFAILNNFFQENNLRWKYCIGHWFMHWWCPSYVLSFWQAASVIVGRCRQCKMDPLPNTPWGAGFATAQWWP